MVLRDVLANEKRVKQWDLIPAGAEVETGISAEAHLLTINPIGHKIHMSAGARIKLVGILDSDGLNLNLLASNKRVTVQPALNSAYRNLIVAAAVAQASTDTAGIEVVNQINTTTFGVVSKGAKVRMRTFFERKYGPEVYSVPFLQTLLKELVEHEIDVPAGHEVTINNALGHEIDFCLKDVHSVLDSKEAEALLWQLQKGGAEAQVATTKLQTMLEAKLDITKVRKELALLMKRTTHIRIHPLPEAKITSIKQKLSSLGDFETQHAYNSPQYNKDYEQFKENHTEKTRQLIQSLMGGEITALKKASGSVFRGYIRRLGEKWEVVGEDGSALTLNKESGDIYPWKM